MKQKEIFLKREGNSWYSRNKDKLAARKLPDEDAILREILELPQIEGERHLKVLEIGCGDGARLAWLKKNVKADCYGIEPSADAVLAATARGVNVVQGVADELPFESKSFDIVIFGFCLYLCDREDLFKIAYEADRVLRNSAWLIIMDFYSLMSRSRIYHHSTDIQTYKMNYSKMFQWHPNYTLLTQKVRHHGFAKYTSDPEEWVAVAVLRKDGEKL